MEMLKDVLETAAYQAAGDGISFEEFVVAAMVAYKIVEKEMDNA